MLNEIPQVFHRSIYSKLPIHIYIYILISYTKDQNIVTLKSQVYLL